MGSRHLVLLKLVWEMLLQCAPGHRIAEKTHYYRVEYAGKTYPALPKGSHSDRGRRSGQAEIEAGHVRKLIRHLGIDEECARRVIPGL
jgi:hypothetical protein